MATPEDIERKLVCTICLHVLTEPKLLTCGHTFCLRCLQSHISHAKSHETVLGVLGMRCPVCREFISAPDSISPPLDWASKYKPNYIVQEILEVHFQNKTRKPFCPMHDGKLVELYCRDCNAAVCDRCVALLHRACNEVVELAVVLKERQNVSSQQLTTVNRMIAQCVAKRKRCETGKFELDSIEHDVTQKIDRECRDIIKKVASHVVREGERLKQEVTGQCQAGKTMVSSYVGKCEELELVLHRMKTFLQNKVKEFTIPTASNQQDEKRVGSTLDKLGRAVVALENPCQFEVGLSFDDTALTQILTNLHLGQVNTIKISKRLDSMTNNDDDDSFSLSDTNKKSPTSRKLYSHLIYVDEEERDDCETEHLEASQRNDNSLSTFGRCQPQMNGWTEDACGSCEQSHTLLEQPLILNSQPARSSPQR